jgi:hypothetical protein
MGNLDQRAEGRGLKERVEQRILYQQKTPFGVCVFPNNDASELVFTLYRRPEMSDQEFAEDAKAVEKDCEVKDFT